MSQTEQEEKQQFLKDEVDKGLDVETCQQFLVSLKPIGGDDLDNWNLEELKQAIEKFKDTQKQQAQVPVEIQDQEQQENIEKSEKDQKQEQIQQSQQQPQQNYDPVYVGCYQTQETELSPDQANAKIIAFKKESAGFFQSSYIVFQIETQPTGWIVYRRYSDFEWLRDSLQKFYPAFIIPPIHKKRSRSFEESYLTKRMIFLQRFLNSIFKQYELRSNMIVKNFLSLTNNNEFKKYQENINKFPTAQTVNRMYSKEGKVNCVAPLELQQYAHLTQDYFYEIDGVYKKIRILSKNLKEIQLQNSLKIYCVGEIFAQLFSQINKLNQVIPIGQATGLAATFLNLNNTMITWGNIIGKQIEQTEEYLNSFFKFQQHYNTSIKQIYETKNGIQSELEKFKSKLNYKKERLFQQQDITKWDLSKESKHSHQELLQNKKLAFQYMCDQETKQELGMEKLVGYYTNQIYSQTQLFFKHQQQELVGHFIKFCQVQAFNITDHHQLWADAITNLQNNLMIKQHQTKQVIVESIG